MKILVLEDKGVMYIELKETIEDLNSDYEVIPAFQVSEAMDKFKVNKLDFMIIDLYVPPSGLTTTETNESINGKLSGWLWLANYVFPLHSSYRKKVIIYSDYIKVLKENVDKNEFKDIRLMKKGDFTIFEVIEELKKMI